VGAVVVDPLAGRPDRGRGGAEAGLALLVVIILGTAVALMAHAGLMIGLAMDRAATSSVGVAEVDARLATLVRRTARGMTTLDAPVPPGVSSRRLSAEVLRLRADSAGRGWTGLVWAMDPQTRLDALDAAVVAGVSPAGSTRGRIDASAPDPCRPEWAPPALPSDILVRGWHAPEWQGDDPLDLGPLGASDRERLERPPTGGTDTPDAVFSPESLSLGSGRWEGLLLVDGSLELRAGAIVTGWVGVRGDLTIRGGAVLEGIARVGGGLTIAPGGLLEPNPCSALERLLSVDALVSPRLIGGSVWPSDPPA